MKKFWVWIGIAVVVILAVVLIVMQIRKEEKEIKIGVILELTGPLSRLGERSKRGMEMAVEEINSSGEVKGSKINLIVEDTKSDPKEGVAAFLKLINTYHIPVVTGATGSSIVMACAPIANEKKVVLFSTGATSPLITKAGDYIFRNRLSGEAEVKAMAEFAIKKLNIKKIAVLYVNTDYGVGNKDVFKRTYEDLGGKVLLSEGFDQGESDFRAHLAKIKKLPIEGVYIIAVGENGYILRQAKEMGINVQFLSTVGIEGPDVLKIAGDAANGVIYTVQKFDPSSSDKTKRFSQKYFNKYGEEPDLFAALGYDAIYIITKVINEYGYDAEAIKNGLYKLKNFQGVVGSISFDENGDVQSEVMMKIIKDGKFVPYNP
jgi:branched-chain amino acid transport system substrate-binding protein